MEDSMADKEWSLPKPGEISDNTNEETGEISEPEPTASEGWEADAEPVSGGEKSGESQASAPSSTPEPSTSKTPASIPYKRFQQESLKRKEAEKKLAEFEGKRPRYEQLDNMDKILSGVFNGTASKEEIELVSPLVDKYSEVRSKLEQAGAEAREQISEQGHVDQSTLRELNQLKQQFAQTQQLISTIAQEREVKRHEDTFTKQVSDFFATERGAKYKDDKELLSEAIELAKATPWGLDKCLDTLAKQREYASKTTEQRVVSNLVKGTEKRRGVPPVVSGPSGGTAKSKPYPGSPEYVEYMMNNITM